jgi:hypothetical protein
MNPTAKRLTVTEIPQRVETRLGPLEFTHDFANGYPTDATVEKLYDERDFQRACQAYLWSLPAVSFTARQRGITKERAPETDRSSPFCPLKPDAVF